MCLYSSIDDKDEDREIELKDWEEIISINNKYYFNCFKNKVNCMPEQG